LTTLAHSAAGSAASTGCTPFSGSLKGIARDNRGCRAWHPEVARSRLPTLKAQRVRCA
jgi:hypothetical protein